MGLGLMSDWPLWIRELDKMLLIELWSPTCLWKLMVWTVLSAWFLWIIRLSHKTKCYGSLTCSSYKWDLHTRRSFRLWTLIACPHLWFYAYPGFKVTTQWLNGAQAISWHSPISVYKPAYCVLSRLLPAKWNRFCLVLGTHWMYLLKCWVTPSHLIIVMTVPFIFYLVLHCLQKNSVCAQCLSPAYLYQQLPSNLTLY